MNDPNDTTTGDSTTTKIDTNYVPTYYSPNKTRYELIRAKELKQELRSKSKHNTTCQRNKANRKKKKK